MAIITPDHSVVYHSERRATRPAPAIATSTARASLGIGRWQRPIITREIPTNHAALIYPNTITMAATVRPKKNGILKRIGNQAWITKPPKMR